MSVKRILVVGTMLLMTTGLWAQGAQQTDGNKLAVNVGSGVEQTLIDLENKWVKAGKSSDASMIEPILADSFISMGADGKYTPKSDYVAGFEKSKWEINEISNVKVYPHGNHAVVTGDWRGKGTDRSGKSVDTSERWMDTFMKMPNGKWQAISSGSTTAKM
jgi:ketosteroid isomerase-like protein